jgi:hypothetical protein
MSVNLQMWHVCYKIPGSLLSTCDDQGHGDSVADAVAGVNGERKRGAEI